MSVFVFRSLRCQRNRRAPHLCHLPLNDDLLLIFELMHTAIDLSELVLIESCAYIFITRVFEVQRQKDE